MRAATSLAVLVVACGDVLVPSATVALDELLVLRQQSGVPAPASATFWVRNQGVTVRALRHPDSFATLYMELRFPAGSLASLNGTALMADDSVLVTVQPRAGEYGFTLSPAGLAFTLSSTPSVEFFYGSYGDLSIADAEPAFGNRADYAAALDVWEEVSIGAWRVARGSGSSQLDVVSSAVDAPGTFVLAARR